MSPRAPTPCCFSTEPDGTSRASSTCPTTSPRSSCRLVRRVEPGRERLAVSAPQLALKHRVRKLRRDRRRRMQSLAKSHRSTRNDHLPRNARLGPHRSIAMTFGITRRLHCHVIQVKSGEDYRQSAACAQQNPVEISRLHLPTPACESRRFISCTRREPDGSRPCWEAVEQFKSLTGCHRP